MKKSILFVLVIFAFAPAAPAQAYKCKQANGAVSFQDQPCAKDAVSANIKLPPPDDASTAAARVLKLAATQKSLESGSTPPSSYEESRRRVEEEDNRAKNARNEAYNKSLRCNAARRQLGIAKEQVPIFSRDNKGERQYVKDEDRQAVIARAQKSVDEDCN